MGLSFWGFSAIKSYIILMSLQGVRVKCPNDEAISLKKVNNAPRLPRLHYILARNDMHRKCAFTLAETLITLLVIGVVAALTIPSLMQHINDYTLEKQRVVFERKFDEGLRQMRVAGKLEEQYDSTEAFVAEMGKHFKIAQVCDNNNLTNCFTSKISTNGYTISYPSGTQTAKARSTKGDVINISDTMTTRSLIQNSAYDSNVVGVKFTDGTNLLLTYNPNCIGAAASDTTEDLTKCFGYVADVNYQKAPNVIGKDIVSNMNLSGDFQILSKGYSTPLNYAECEETKKQHPNIIKNCGAINDKDYWAGAVLKCANEGGRLPNSNDVQKLFSQLFDETGNVKNQTLWSYINRNDDGIIDAWEDNLTRFYINNNNKSHWKDGPSANHISYVVYCVK